MGASFEAVAATAMAGELVISGREGIRGLARRFEGDPASAPSAERLARFSR